MPYGALLPKITASSLLKNAQLVRYGVENRLKMLVY